MKNLKIAIIGNGQVVHKHHLQAISKLNLQVPELYDSKKDWHDAINGDADVISICTPNYLHVEQALAALDAGKKVILEKPIGVNPADAKRLLDHPLADTIAVCHQRRFNSQCLEIKRNTKPISYIDAKVLVHRDIPYWNSWRSNWTKSGGGNLINIDIHYLDLMLWWANATDFRVQKASFTPSLYSSDMPIDLAVHTAGKIGNIDFWLDGSTLHPSREISMRVVYEDGSSLVYDTDDATHYDVYEQFLYHDNFVTVRETMTSLELVHAIYEAGKY